MSTTNGTRRTTRLRLRRFEIVQRFSTFNESPKQTPISSKQFLSWTITVRNTMGHLEESCGENQPLHFCFMYVCFKFLFTVRLNICRIVSAEARCAIISSLVCAEQILKVFQATNMKESRHLTHFSSVRCRHLHWFANNSCPDGKSMP